MTLPLRPSAFPPNLAPSAITGQVPDANQATISTHAAHQSPADDPTSLAAAVRTLLIAAFKSADPVHFLSDGAAKFDIDPHWLRSKCSQVCHQMCEDIIKY